MTAIELRDVTKRFGDVVAVDGLDLTVEEGEVFGFLGPNGAGKSTTIDVVLDFVRPTEGQARVLGLDAQADSVAVRERTGVLPEGFDVYDRLTGRKHVEFAMRSKEVDGDPLKPLDRVGLAEDADRPAGDYSKGMTQRLALAMALVGEPDLLVLDEPSTGLDPNGARRMREIVAREADRGATVFFSSHILGQVEATCDRVGIMREGELVAVDSIEGLRDTVGDEQTLRLTVDGVSDDQLDAVRALEGVSSASTDGGVVTVFCDAGAKSAVVAAVEDQGVRVEDFETESASLEELFIAYTEERADEGGRAGEGGHADEDGRTDESGHADESGRIDEDGQTDGADDATEGGTASGTDAGSGGGR